MRRPHDILAYGPDALLLKWQQRIAPDVSRGVHAYARLLADRPGVRECVPAYASLLVTFDPALTDGYRLREAIYELEPPTTAASERVVHELPVCYNGPDLAAVAELTGVSVAAIPDYHADRPYLVYQLGYAPGFGFLGQTIAELEVARRSSPRKAVSAGAVGLAGRQTGVYPAASPGGWQLIGHCPLPLLHPTTGEARLRAGDEVIFRSITAEELAAFTPNDHPWPTR